MDPDFASEQLTQPLRRSTLAPAAARAPPRPEVASPHQVLPQAEVVGLARAAPTPHPGQCQALSLRARRASRAVSAPMAAAPQTAIPPQVAPVGRPAIRAVGQTCPAAAGRSPCAGHCPDAARTPVRPPGTDDPPPPSSLPGRVASIQVGPGSPYPRPATTADCQATAEQARAPPSPGRPGAPAALPDRRDRRSETASAARPRTGRFATAGPATSRRRPPKRPDWPTREKTRECNPAAPRQEPQRVSPPGQSGGRRLGTSDSATFSWISPRNHDLTD
jgi:hypothetical protein